MQALTVDDLLRITVLDDVAISPDGLMVAVTLRTTRRAANDYCSAIHLYAVDGDSTWQLTAGPDRDWAPSWSPDGTHLAFLSDRSGSAQVWSTTLHGETCQVTELPEGVRERPVWSPDGRTLAIVVWQETESSALADNTGLEAGAAITVITRLDYRLDGQGYLGNRYNHIWLVDVETGAVRPLTAGPTDNHAPAWSPAGAEIAFVSNRHDERLAEFRSALWVVPSSGGPARRVTPEDGVALAPSWSPDGKFLAYSGLSGGRGYGANHRLWLASPAGDKPPRALIEDLAFEGHVGGNLLSDTWNTAGGSQCLHWAPDSSMLYFVAVRRARSHILSADLTGTVRGLVEGDRACTLLSLSRDGQNIAFAVADPTHAADLYVLSRTEDARWRQPRALSRLNPWLDTAGLEQPIAFTARSADGRAIDAWLVPPRGQRQPVPGPIVLYVHGGPHSIFGYTFFFDMHVLSAHGYAVLYCNPRATRSYGDDFACCNLGRWGEGDAPDQFAALDYTTGLGWVDPRRVGVLGLSYGGYMVNWLIAHSTRFRAAVSENGISNLLSVYGTSDGGWYFMPIELGVEPDEDPALYARLSPLGAAGQIETPLLLLHCEDDTSCPIEQAEQLFIALKRRGRIVEMVRFAGEGHIMLLNGRPAARLMRRLQILRWFHAYL